jgi:hypothetical protein
VARRVVLLLSAVVGALAVLAAGPTATVAGPLPGTVAAGAAAAYEVGGSYEPLSPPRRILDTRTSGGAFTAGETRTVRPATSGAVPASGVRAVVVNLTVTGPTSSGFLTAWPVGTPPTTSSLNFAAAVTRANLVTVPLASDGTFRLYNSAGRTHVVVDVLGWYHAAGTVPATSDLGAAYYPDVPRRLYDSRQHAVVAPGAAFSLLVDFGSAADAQATWALAVHLTAVAPRTGGWLTVWDGVTPPPTTSTLNYVPGRTVANMAVVGSAVCEVASVTYACFGIRNSSAGAVDVVVDYVGAYADDDGSGTRFRSVAPRRLLDSRYGTGTTVGPFTAGQRRTVAVPGAVAGTTTTALVLNATLVAPTTRTFLTLWSGADAMPGTSNVNADAGQVIANAAVPVLAATASGGNSFAVHNAAGSTHVLADVVGAFDYQTTFGGRRAPADARAAALERFSPSVGLRVPAAALLPGAARSSSRPAG